MLGGGESTLLSVSGLANLRNSLLLTLITDGSVISHLNS